MLTRLWAALTSGLKTEDLSSLHVTQWQNHKKVLLIYLLWRWISAIVFLAITVCSSIDIGQDKSAPKHENHYTKWWIVSKNLKHSHEKLKKLKTNELHFIHAVPNELDNFAVHGTGLARCSDSHESFNGQ